MEQQSAYDNFGFFRSASVHEVLKIRPPSLRRPSLLIIIIIIIPLLARVTCSGPGARRQTPSLLLRMRAPLTDCKIKIKICVRVFPVYGFRHGPP